MADLAGLTQLEQSWRTLTDEEKPRAIYKLGQASRHVRRHFPDVDARIASGDLVPEDVSDVIVAMVERAFPIRDGVQSKTEAVGPFNTTIRYFDAQSGMYLTAEEEAALAPPSAGSAGAFSVRPSFVPDAFR